jgi:hypothetical protein
MLSGSSRVWVLWGTVLFEQAKQKSTSPQDATRLLQNAAEKFTQAIESDPTLFEASFLLINVTLSLNAQHFCLACF